MLWMCRVAGCFGLTLCFLMSFPMAVSETCPGILSQFFECAKAGKQHTFGKGKTAPMAAGVLPLWLSVAPVPNYPLSTHSTTRL